VDLHEIELELLEALVGRRRGADDLALTLGVEHAECVRRLHYLVDRGLVRYERTNPLAERSVVLTEDGAARIVAERVVGSRLPAPGVHSGPGRLSDVGGARKR
jgi:hypothetical protein